MNYLGIEYQLKNLPELDGDFIPFGAWMDAYLKGATHPISIAVERNDGKITVRSTKIYNTPEMWRELEGCGKRTFRQLSGGSGFAVLEIDDERVEAKYYTDASPDPTETLILLKRTG